MKTQLLLIVMALFPCFDTLAQNMYSVSGSVVEKETGDAVVAATIQMVSLPDSSFVDGATSGANGEFCFRNVRKGLYALKVSYIGMNAKCVGLDLTSRKENDVNIGKIAMVADAIGLKDIEVTAHAAKVAV